MGRMISWPGAKHRQMEQLMMFVPSNYSDQVAICEPFFGTGAFTFELISNTYGPVFAAEANKPLHNWWTHMMHDSENMIDRMSYWREHYAEAKTNRLAYENMREEWNDMNAEDPIGLDTAALLWCLIYQSTNNLARFNKSGQYNQTHGLGRSVPDPKEVFDYFTMQPIVQLEEATRYGCFVEDFEDALCRFMSYLETDIDGGICYLDPPYIVQTETYEKGCWDKDKLASLMNYIEGLEELQCHWLYTEYFKKGDKTHPYEQSLRTHYRVFPFERKKDARPNGKQLETVEVIIIGSAVDIYYKEDHQHSLFEGN